MRLKERQIERGRDQNETKENRQQNNDKKEEKILTKKYKDTIKKSNIMLYNRNKIK